MRYSEDLFGPRLLFSSLILCRGVFHISVQQKGTSDGGKYVFFGHRDVCIMIKVVAS